jgi:hypothetical protein
LGKVGRDRGVEETVYEGGDDNDGVVRGEDGGAGLGVVVGGSLLVLQGGGALDVTGETEEGEDVEYEVVGEARIETSFGDTVDGSLRARAVCTRNEWEGKEERTEGSGQGM